MLLGVVSGGFESRLSDGYYVYVAHYQVLDWIKCQMFQTNNEEEDKYPDILTVSSRGAAAEKQWRRMGIYKKMCGVTRNEKPVWKMRGGGDEYIFYSGKHVWS